MSKPLRADLPVLRGSAQDLSGVAEWLRSGLGPLDEYVSGLVGGSWSGDASAEYGKVWRDWHEGANAVASGLSAFSEWMASAEKALRAASGSGDGSGNG